MQHSTLNSEPSPRTIQRIVGLGLLVYVLLVAVQVVTRTMSYDSQAPFDEALLMIGVNLHLYQTSMYSGLTANLILLIAAAGLYSIFGSHHPPLTRTAAFLLLGAAIVSMMSSGAGLAIASIIQEFTGEQVQPLRSGSVLSSALAVETVRATFGRIGFTLSALGVMALSSLIAWKGILPRWLGWLGIGAGIVMFFIWVDVPAVVHRLGGVGYLLWLALSGGWLLIRGTRKAAESN